MGLLDIIAKSSEQQQPVDPNKLNIHEIQLALLLLKASTIKGDQVETFYNLVVKLQNQYIDQSKQQQ